MVFFVFNPLQTPWGTDINANNHTLSNLKQLTVKGTGLSETKLGYNNVRIGETAGGSSRIMFEDNTSSTLLEIDNLNGTLRFFTAGAVLFSHNGLGLTVVGDITTTSSITGGIIECTTGEAILPNLKAELIYPNTDADPAITFTKEDKTTPVLEIDTENKKVWAHQFETTSTTVVSNLNADLLDGVEGSAYAKVGATSATFTPANPTGTTSATQVMMGLGSTIKITPTKTGIVRYTLSGDMVNNTNTERVDVQLAYGSGTAPSNGAAATGTAIGSTLKTNSLTGMLTNGIPFCQEVIITGLGTGTAYWFDARVNKGVNGTASILNLTATLQELTS